MVLSLTLTIGGILAIIVGLLIITFPKVIRWALGLYLILIGVLSLVELNI